MDGQRDGWMDGWTDGQTDGQTDGWTYRWMDGWTNGWMDGRIERNSTGHRPLGAAAQKKNESDIIHELQQYVVGQPTDEQTNGRAERRIGELVDKQTGGPTDHRSM